MAWSWRSLTGRQDKADDRAASEASPPANVYPFVVPNYRRGGPYSQEAVPTFADSPARTGVKDRYDTPTEQHRELPQGWGPPSTRPPGQWIGYNQDNIRRSKRDEHVLNADEGPTKWHHPWSWHPHNNPYWAPRPNIGRIQRPPHQYSFLRDPGKNYLGRRDLTGNHYSQAQTVTDQQAVALKGMQPGRHRRSTFRLEPIAFGELTTSISERSGFSPQQATVESASAGYPSRSFRLT